jgi:hypothetical protein
MMQMCLLKKLAVVGALVVTMAGSALATASAPVLAAGCGIQVAEKGSSDGQETHG